MSTTIKSLSHLMFLLIYILIVGCKNNVVTPLPVGKSIKSIEANVINFDDGTNYTINEDSVAKIFYLIRHAEKDTVNKVDPLLTQAGLARSAKVADIMMGTRVDVIYSTMTMRTLFTVDSLADIKMMQSRPYDNKALKDLLVKVKESSNDNRIFIVGHSNTIPAIANSIAGNDVFKNTFDESDYGNFVIVVVKKSGEVDILKLRY